MENKQGYDPSEFEDDDYTTPQPDAGKSIRGYRIVIIILSVILAALSVLYFSIHRQQMLDNELLQADRDSIQNDLGRLGLWAVRLYFTTENAREVERVLSDYVNPVPFEPGFCTRGLYLRGLE